MRLDEIRRTLSARAHSVAELRVLLELAIRRDTKLHDETGGGCQAHGLKIRENRACCLAIAEEIAKQRIDNEKLPLESTPYLLQEEIHYAAFNAGTKEVGSA